MKLLRAVVEALVAVVTVWLLCLHAADAIALQWWQILMPAAAVGMMYAVASAVELSIVTFLVIVRLIGRHDSNVVRRTAKARQLRHSVLLMCVVGLSASAIADPPAKPILLIVHSDECPPCRVFDRVYTLDSELRSALNRAFDVRELDMGVPSQRLQAQQYNVKDVPTYIVLRDGKPVSTHRGFSSTMEVAAVNRAIADLMDDLQVEWPLPRVDPPRKSPPASPRVEPKPIASTSHPGPTIDQVARDGITKLAGQSRELQASQNRTEQRVEAIAADVRDLSTEVRQSHTQISRTVEQSLKTIQSERVSTREQLEEIIRKRITLERPAAEPTRDISTEIPATDSAPGPTASKWLRVLAWAGKTGLAIAAPEIAIPGSIGLTVAGLGLRWLFGRRSKGKATAAAQRVDTRVVPIAVDAPIVPPKIHTETHFVEIDSDRHRQAHAWAKEQLARRYPGASPTLETLDSLINQYLEGRKD